MGEGSSGRLSLGLSRSPRAEAAVILGRVLRSGAYSNVVLGNLGGEPDERLVRRLVYGTLRYLVRVDHILAKASNRPLADIHPALLDILRVGAWELRFGESAAHAALYEAVSAASVSQGERAGGFVNAVLRNVQQRDEDLPTGPAGRALELGIAPWIYQRLSDDWGQSEAGDFLRASLEPARRTGRARPGREHAGTPLGGIPGAVEAGDDVSGLVLMDPSSVAVGLAVGVSPGMAVLDLAAAPGGKTLHMFDQLAGTGGLIASDRHPRRAASARRRLQREGADVPWVVADGIRAPFPPRTFDRVLLDAPCTGLGTLRRRPEIRHRLTPDSPARFGAGQHRLLDAALQLVKPDGLVVYAVCTVFPEETTEIVANRRATPPVGLPGRPAGKGWLLGPHLTGSDGMFISVVRP